jgi:hypothetical protein
MRLPETSNVRTTFNGVDIVYVGENVFFKIIIIRKRHFNSNIRVASS